MMWGFLKNVGSFVLRVVLKLAKFIGKFLFLSYFVMFGTFLSVSFYVARVPAAAVKAEVLREDPYLTFENIRMSIDSVYIKHVVSFIILDSEELNAYTDYKNVYVTKGLLKYISSTDELAFVIGHELGHIYSGLKLREYPLGPTPPDVSKAMELRADELGLEFANNAGYRACRGAEFFFRLANMYGNSGGDTHPLNSKRFRAIMCQNVFEGEL